METKSTVGFPATNLNVWAKRRLLQIYKETSLSGHKTDEYDKKQRLWAGRNIDCCVQVVIVPEASKSKNKNFKIGNRDMSSAFYFIFVK